jgi:capsid protein
MYKMERYYFDKSECTETTHDVTRPEMIRLIVDAQAETDLAILQVVKVSRFGLWAERKVFEAVRLEPSDAFHVYVNVLKS